MIGRIESTPGRRLATLAAFASLLATFGASPSTTLAQTAKIRGAVPNPPPDEPPAPREMPAPPGSMALPDLGDAPPAAPRDPKVRPAELEDKGPLPVAKDPPPGAPTPGASASADGSNSGPDPFVLPPDRLNLGKQRVQLTVDVQASPVLNLHRESTVKLVVANESPVDASGVSVVYQLPDGLELRSSTPNATQDPVNKSLYYFKKPMLASGSAWTIVLTVFSVKAKACEHAATVTAKTGSRAITTVQEPKLKVEATSSPGRVLKGSQVTFQVAVHNPGTGPARNVIVQAKLSSGLRLGGDDLVEQTIPLIGPGDRVTLDPLIVDTIAGGQQTCTVEVRSPDVNAVIEDQRVARSVDVTKPELALKLEGQESRFTGQTIEYKLSVSNPGTAPAKNVRVLAGMPKEGGQLISINPASLRFDKATRKLLWPIDQLEPGQTLEISYVYMTSTPGLYRATAEATSRDLQKSDTFTTDVSGLAVLDLQASQTSRVIDVGKSNYYDITIKNVGTKEATKLQLSGTLVGSLKVIQCFGVEKGFFNAAGGQQGAFIFPTIDRLAVDQSITLSLEVQATESGPAGCKLKLAHAEMLEGDAPVEDVISTTVTGNGKGRAAGRP